MWAANVGWKHHFIRGASGDYIHMKACLLITHTHALMLGGHIWHQGHLTDLAHQHVSLHGSVLPRGPLLLLSKAFSSPLPAQRLQHKHSTRAEVDHFRKGESGSFYQLLFSLSLAWVRQSEYLAGLARDIQFYSPTELMAQTQPKSSTWELGQPPTRLLSIDCVLN